MRPIGIKIQLGQYLMNLRKIKPNANLLNAKSKKNAKTQVDKLPTYAIIVL